MGWNEDTDGFDHLHLLLLWCEGFIAAAASAPEAFATEWKSSETHGENCGCMCCGDPEDRGSPKTFYSKNFAKLLLSHHVIRR